ncbi:hypothetical protein CDIK_4150, partial [Cucumispora dikerogammari]
LADELIIVPRYPNQTFIEACKLWDAQPADINSQTLPIFSNQLKVCCYDSAGFSFWNNQKGEYVLFQDNSVEVNTPYLPQPTNVFCRKRIYYHPHSRDHSPLRNPSVSNSLSPLVAGLLLGKSSCCNPDTPCDASKAIRDLLCQSSGNHSHNP